MTTSSSPDAALEACPKSMTYGPCGGVHADGTCEVDRRPCPFVDHYTIAPPPPVGGADAGSGLRLLTAGRDRRDPLIVVDVRAPRAWSGDLRSLWEATGQTLAGCIALIGEHVDNPLRDDDTGALPTAAVIEILGARDVPVIVTVTGRDRSAAEASQLIHAHRDAGAAAIHCVTGDHPAALGITRPARFGTEAMQLIALAAEAGLPATVAESPVSPGYRAQRLAMKELAGAAACVLNHCGEADDAVAFADACRQADARLPLIAPVAMVGDAAAAAALAAFPGLRLPRHAVHALDAPDTHAAALHAAAEMCAALAASGRFAGVNLSGSGWAHDPIARLEATAAFVDVAREAWRRGQLFGDAALMSPSAEFGS